MPLHLWTLRLCNYSIYTRVRLPAYATNFSFKTAELRGGQSHRSIGPCPTARLAANKIINDLLVIHSNTCSLTRVIQLHIAVCVSHITLYVTASIHVLVIEHLYMYICKHYH